MLLHYQNYEQKLFALAMSFTRNEQDAKDLLQDTCIKIFSNSHRFQAGTNFLSWAGVVLRNSFINDFRRKSRRQKKLDEQLHGTIWESSTTSNKGEEKLDKDIIDRYIQNLAPHLSTPLKLFHQGYSYVEIADMLDCPLGTLKSRLFLARKHLKKQINRDLLR